MAETEYEILKSVAASKFKGIASKLREIFKPTLEGETSCSQQQLQGYRVFVIRFLHAVVSLKQQPTDVSIVQEILQASIVCCNAHLSTQGGPDAQFGVPKLLYYILLKYKGKEHLEEIYRLSEQLYDIATSDGKKLHEDASQVIHAVYVVLWNFAVKLIPKDLTGPEEIYSKISRQLAVCVKFLSLLPNHDLLLDRLQDITAKSVQWTADNQKLKHSNSNKKNAKAEIKCDHHEILLEMFKLVITRLSGSCKSVEDNKDLQHMRTLLQIRCIVTYWLVKVMLYNQAEQMLRDIQDTNCDNIKVICKTSEQVYNTIVQTDKTLNGMTVRSLEECLEELSLANDLIDYSVEPDNILDLKVLHRCYHCFMQQLTKNCFEHFKGQFSGKIVHVLTQTCDIFAILCLKIIERRKTEEDIPVGKKDKNTDLESERKKRSEYIVRILGGHLSVYYKKLEILFHALQENSEGGYPDGMLDQVIETATTYKNLLANDSLPISDKVLQSERNNIIYICSVIGKLLYSREEYHYAAPLLKIAGYHLHLSNSPKAIRTYQLSADCYRNLQLWLEGTKVVVDVLNIGLEAVTPAVGMWFKLRKEAISNGEQLFTCMTFKSVVENSGVKLKDYTLRDLLILEYHVWRKYSKRDLDVEYSLLTEMLEKSTCSAQKAEVMIELAGNLFLTRKTYQNRSAKEMLNKALILLDKSNMNEKSTLATAQYMKYSISHEETLENLSLNLLEKDKSEESSVEDDKQKPFQYDTPYTLEAEQKNLPCLIRAMELWEMAYSEEHVQKEQGSQHKGELLFDNEMHIDTMISCGTRLIALKQPAYALRVLDIACRQLKYSNDSKQAIKLKIRTSKALILLGKFDEAEQMINSLETDGESVEKLLVMAEIFLLMGKKEEGVSLVMKVIQAKKSSGMTHKMCLVSGTAKRLLSMFLCFPEGHKISPVNEDILSLASEAVKLHFTVLNLEIKNDRDPGSKNQDKWILMFEFFQSLLHMCQLYRYTGLPRMAECYVKEGIKISQAEGLPQWSCEFMFEALRAESMQVNGTRSIAAVNSIKAILNTNTSETNPDSSVPKKASCPKLVDNESVSVSHNQSSNILQSNKQAGGNSSPEKDGPQQLDSVQREEMSKLTVPECYCVKYTNTSQCDIHSHRLYVKAGIVLSDFLSQYEMESDAYRILSDLQEKYPHYLKGFDLRMGQKDGKMEKRNPLSLKDKSNFDSIDPHVKFLSLEALCLQAESLLSQRKFSQVQELWSFLKNLETKGYWNNVIHSDILMTRMALCQASSFMLSLQSTADRLLDNSSLLTDKCEVTELNRLDCSLSNNNFADSVVEKQDEINQAFLEKNQDNQENVFPNVNSILQHRKSLSSSKSVLTPLRSKRISEDKESTHNILGTLVQSAKKQKISQVLGTPLVGRKAKLDFLMESDDEDDLVFPTLKPVNQKSLKKEKGRPVRARKGANSVDKTSLTDNEIEISATVVNLVDIPTKDDESASASEPKTSKTLGQKSENAVKKGGRRNILEDSTKETYKQSINNGTSMKKKACGKSLHPMKDRGDVFQLDISPIQNKPSIESSDEIGKMDFGSINCQEDKVIPLDKLDTGKASCFRSKQEKSVTGRSKIPKCSLKNNTNRSENLISSVVPSENSNISHENGDISAIDQKSTTAKTALKVQGKTISVSKTAGKASRKKKVNNVDKNEEPVEAISNNHIKEETKPLICNNKTKAIKTLVREEDGKKDATSVLQIKGDVFDFDFSPDVKGKAKSKGQPVKSSRKTKKVDTKQTAKNKDSQNDAKTSTTRNRRNLRNNIETARTIDEFTNINCFDYSSEEDIQTDSSIDLEERDNSITLSVADFQDIHLEHFQSPVTFSEPDSQLSIISMPENNDMMNVDLDFEPIEIMRGGVKQKGSGKGSKSKPTVADNGSSGDMEVVRSSDAINFKALMDNISMDCLVDVSAEPGNSTQESSRMGEDKIMELLEELCGRVSHFAPYPQYPQMCQVLAAKYVHTNPQRAAFLLSESIAVSFRHHAAVIRGKNKSSSRTGQSTRMSRDAAIQENMFANRETLLFDKDENFLQTMVDVIPPDWCVVQLSVTYDLLQCQHFLLTRFVRGKTPVVIETPAFNSPQGRYVLKDFERLQVRNRSLVEVTDKSDWWKQRIELNTDLQGIIENMEKFWIGPWKNAFLPPLGDKTISSIQKEIKKVLKIEVDSSKLELMLLSKGILEESKLPICIKGLFGSQYKDSDIETIISIVKKFPLTDVTLTSQHHVILILDKNVQHLPWECLPVLSERSVSRMPCLSHLYYQLSFLCTQERSLFVKGVNPKSLTYIVNPDGDLSHTEEQFKDWFKSEEGWTGICGTKPTREQYIEAITERDLLIYLGHGSGGRYFPAGEIEKLQAHAVTVLMGCSSGKLLVKGQLEPYGIMTSYFLAGCPCVVANLWDVTDKDIDKYTMELLRTWLKAEDGSYLIPFVQKARKACKMKYLVGSAPVVYGLPVFINRGSNDKKK